MFQQKLEALLLKKVREGVTANLVGGFLLMLAGVVVVIITFWIAYALLWFVMLRVTRLPEWLHLMICGGFVVLLFIGNAKTNPDELMQLEVETLDGSPPFSVYVPHGGLLSNVNIFSGETLSSAGRLIAAILFAGPQLCVAALEAFRRVGRLRQVNITRCAAVMGVLLGKAKRLPFAEIAAKLPQVNLTETLPQLGNIDGVVFLTSEPYGLTLTADLRQELLEAAVHGTA